MLKTNKIGVVVDSFKTDIYSGLEKAKRVGVDGVQMYAVDNEIDPDRLSKNKLIELKKYIESLGLEVSALCGEVGINGFQDKNTNHMKIEKSKRIIDMAISLGSNIVTTHIGIVPEDEKCEIYDTMLQACEELGVYANSMNAFFAVETGPETADRLKAFLDNLSTNGVSVNFDPANFVMVTGEDPVKSTYLLKDYIVHTHVKDGLRLNVSNPKDIYGYLGYQPKLGEDKRCCKEVPLGEGSVDFVKYFTALSEIGYKGYLTIERETGENPELDIENAVKFIKKYKR